MEITQSFQETLLTLLCMDNRCAIIIRNSLPASSFEGYYGLIAREVYPYIDKHKVAPKTDLDSLLDLLTEKKSRRARGVRSSMELIKQIWAGKPDPDYNINRLGQRLRYHNIRVATRELFAVFNTGQEDDSSIDQMEDILTNAVRDRVETFAPGTRLGDKKRVRQGLFKDQSEEVFPTGIRELDAHGLGPRRKQLHIFIGLKKVGKTRWLVQLGERAAMQGGRVLHISLEMDEDRMLRRYYQSFFGIAAERKVIRRKKFKKEDGYLIGMRTRKVKVRLALDDRNLWKGLSPRIDRYQGRLNNIIIKAFPTRQLTFRELVAHLDRLELQDHFVPDLLIVDYPKLMKINIDNFRLSLGALLEDLRGLAVERNIAVATVAQSHRLRKSQEGEVESSDIGEDFSALQTLDVGLVFRQSRAEASLGLARILVSEARDAPSGWEVLIAQNYDMGQFCVDSVRMQPAYKELIRKKAGIDDDDDEED